MFKKEAMKYQKEVIANKDYPHSIAIDWQRGAVFGYKECFEQIKKIVNEGTRLDCIIPELLRIQEQDCKE